MYLVKFFHRPPGDDDRELLLIPSCDPMIIGIRMHGSIDTQAEDFLREQFSDIGDAVAAYRRHAAELVTAGYVETTHTRHTRRNLLRGPQPKLAWQRNLDNLVLTALSAPLEEQTRHLAALQDTRAARDTLAIRKAGKTPHYAWSIAESDLEARIFEVLSWAYLRAEDPTAALEAIEHAYRIVPSQDRGAQRAAILCDYFPDRREEAFEVELKALTDGIKQREAKLLSFLGVSVH